MPCRIPCWPFALAVIWGAAGTTLVAAEPRPEEHAGPELVLQSGFGNNLRQVAFSPGGKVFLTNSYDSVVRLWHVATGAELLRIQRSSGEIVSVAFSPDGKQLLTGETDGAARLRDATTGKELLRYPNHGAEKYYDYFAVFSPDGKRVLAGGADGMAHLHDAATGKELRAFPGPTCLTFSPAGRLVLTGDYQAYHLWDSGTGEELWHATGPAGALGHAAFSPDGKHVLLLENKEAHLRDVASGKEVAHFLPGQAVAAVAFSPDGKRILLATIGSPPASEANVLLLDPAGGKEVARLQGSPGAPVGTRSPVFSPDGKSILTGGADNAVSLWDAATGRLIRRFQGQVPLVQDVVFSPDGQRILMGCDDRLARLWDAATASELIRFPARCDRVAFSPDGKQALTAGTYDRVRLWDCATGKEVHSAPTKFVGSVLLSPDGKRVLMDESDGMRNEVRLCQFPSWEEIRRFQGRLLSPSQVSADGTQLVTKTAEREVCLWDVTTGKPLLRYEASPADRSLALSPRGDMVAVGHSEGIANSVTVYDAQADRINSGRARQTFRVPEGRGFKALAFTPDGKGLLAAEGSRTVRVWDLASAREIFTFQGYPNDILATAFSPDGKRLLIASRDHTVRLFDLATGKEICRFVCTSDGSLVITPDNYYLTSRGGLSGVAFRVGNRAFPFDQFDLKYNRPDIVLERLGLAPPEVIDAYRLAYRKRLQRMHLTEETVTAGGELPEVAVTSQVPLATGERALRLGVRATDPEADLDRVLVAVNGVPVGGTGGVSLRAKKARAWEQEVAVELSPGPNRIQVSALNERGAESLRETFDVTCTAPPVRPDLYVVAVGISDYVNPDGRLTYPDKDARDLAAFWEGCTADYGHIRVLRLLNREATRENILRARDFLQQAGVDDHVIVFLAGHGLLDANADYYFATADIDFAAPAGRGLSFDALEGLLDGLRARRKLLLMDTCHSGEVDADAPEAEADQQALAARGVKVRAVRGLARRDAPRVKSATAALHLSERFADLRRGSGTVAVAAASGMEYAYESPRWNNGVFTYALLEGLKDRAAAAGGDGEVRVSQLQAYVARRVGELTDQRQTPAARRENLVDDFPVLRSRAQQLADRDRYSREARQLRFEGRLADAVAAAETALAIERQALGKDHPDVAASLRDLAEMDEEREDFPAALAARRDVLAAEADRFGASDPRTARDRLALSRTEELSQLSPLDRRRLQPAPALVAQLGPPYAPTQIAFSPDGRQVLTAWGRFLDLWDTGTGRLLRRFVHRSSASTRALAFAPDGQRFAVSGGYDNRAYLRDAATGKDLVQFAGHAGPVTALAFTPDGSQLVTASADRTLRLWDAATGRQLRQFTGHTDRVTSAALSPDGKTLFSGGQDGSARLWDLTTGEGLRPLREADVKALTAAAFSPDGKLVWAGGPGGLVLWNVADGTVVRQFGGGALAVTPPLDANTLAWVETNGGLTRWDGTSLRSFGTGDGKSIVAAAFSPDGRLICTSESGAQAARLRDAGTGRPFLPLGEPCESLSCAAVSPDGALLAFGGRDRTAYLWDLRQGKEVRRLAGHEDTISSVQFSSDSRLLLTGSRDRMARLWDVSTGQEVRRFGGTESLRSAALSPDGRWVLTAGDNGTARLWDAATGAQQRAFEGENAGPANGALFCPGGKDLLTSGKTVALWEAATGKELHRVELSPVTCGALALSPDGKYLAGCGPRDSVVLWDLDTGQAVRRFVGHTSMANSLSFSRDGRRLFSAACDTTARLWDVTTGEELRRFEGHCGWVNHAGFSPDDRLAVTAGEDGTVRLWVAGRGEEVCRLVSFRGGMWAVIAPGGRYDAADAGDVAGLHFVTGNTARALRQFRERSYEPGLLARLLEFRGASTAPP